MPKPKKSNPVTYGLWMGVGSTFGTILALLLVGLLLGSTAQAEGDPDGTLTTTSTAGCWP